MEWCLFFGYIFFDNISSKEHKAICTWGGWAKCKDFMEIATNFPGNFPGIFSRHILQGKGKNNQSLKITETRLEFWL